MEVKNRQPVCKIVITRGLEGWVEEKKLDKGRLDLINTGYMHTL
jgi:hypothetical protein